jgi:gamma-glutamylcyclotransferase (GGCT)/AIG2-like uncharacterized protein YtfP
MGNDKIMGEIFGEDSQWLYFAYGMNMSQDGMRWRCPESRFIGTANLDGWVRVERGVYDLKPRDGARTYGALFALAPRDLPALDRLEGFPSFYTRVGVKVEYNGAVLTAMTYTMTECCSRGVTPLGYGYATTCVVAALENDTPLDTSLQRWADELARVSWSHPKAADVARQGWKI